jgi:hypothetical protein
MYLSTKRNVKRSNDTLHGNSGNTALPKGGYNELVKK